MNNYIFYIEFEDGDEVHARSVGNSVPEASERLFESEEYKRFAAGRKVKTAKYQIEQTIENVLNPLQYSLSPSAEQEGWYVVTDKKAMVVVRFQKGKFNETQKVTHLNDAIPQPLELAAIMRGIAEYLLQFHKELL